MTVDENRFEITLLRSTGLFVFTICLVVVALLLIALAPVYLSAKMAGALIIVVWSAWNLKLFALAKSKTLIHQAGNWTLLDQTGIRELKLSDSQFVSQWLVILYGNSLDGQTMKLMIACDAVQPDAHRRLRRLLIGSPGSD